VPHVVAPADPRCADPEESAFAQLVQPAREAHRIVYELDSGPDDLLLLPANKCKKSDSTLVLDRLRGFVHD
jgi:hypothetical protein